MEAQKGLGIGDGPLEERDGVGVVDRQLGTDENDVFFDEELEGASALDAHLDLVEHARHVRGVAVEGDGVPIDVGGVEEKVVVGHLWCVDWRSGEHAACRGRRSQCYHVRSRIG